jgi:cold shock CspA family protein
MRTHGTLAKWNDERGFGFIQPTTGTGELFVHISAFPRDGIRPRIGELISFEVDRRSDGKQRAVRVMRPGNYARRDREHRTRPTAPRHGAFAPMAGVLLFAVIGWYAYFEFSAEQAATHPSLPTPTPHAVRASPAALLPSFACDGRTMCSQMTSCAEATFFTRQCPGARMDGDGDGKPCESQWCTGEHVDLIP